MRWPWTKAEKRAEELSQMVMDRLALDMALAQRVAALESRVAELGRKAPTDDPTGEGLPGVVRAAIDSAVEPWNEDRVAVKARGRLIRGARARLRAGITDAVVADWVRTGEDQ